MTDEIVDDVESEVMREVRSLIADVPAEGWLETDTQMVYHNGESKWGGDGVPETDMVGIKQGATNKTPTNADCIEYLYGYEEIDDPKIPDAIYYRRCKKPTATEELYRRHSFRVRRRRFFARSAIYIGGSWFLEPYFPDPEDPEWSWKEGIEMNRPAQSLYQLNEGKVFWDPYKHLRVNGVHPHYKFASHERCIDRKVPPNPIRHVQRPLEQFQRFNEELFPSSELTMEGSLDAVRYHPLYKGIRTKFDGTEDDPIDLTTTLEDHIFYLPEGEE